MNEEERSEVRSGTVFESAGSGYGEDENAVRQPGVRRRRDPIRRDETRRLWHPQEHGREQARKFGLGGQIDRFTK